MNMKDLAIHIDVINQFMSMDIGNPLVKNLIKKELKTWFKVTDNLLDYYKKQFPEETIEDMESKTELIYLLVKVGLAVPKEERENLIKTFKEISHAIDGGN
jgi:hypothetical protein